MPAKASCGSCGDCERCKRAAYMREWYRRPGNAEAQRQSQKLSRQRRYEQVVRYDHERGRRAESRLVAKARRSVLRAVAKGTLRRPERCERCYSIGEPFADGRAGIQAHHEDYTEPLEVIWLCRSCHMKIHRKVA